MPTSRRPAHEPPLASYVLRVSGRPAVLHYELHNVRTGERHRFQHADALAAFLRQQGLALESIPFEPDDGPPG